MSPQKRNRNNRGLPTGWRYRKGFYWLRTTRQNRDLFDGKKEFPLGKTLGEAHQVYGDRVKSINITNTMPQLLDRYEVEVTPTKAEVTQRMERKRIQKLRLMLQDFRPDQVEAHHCYQVQDLLAKNHGPTTANRHTETLSHVFTMACRWGVIRVHPMIEAGFRKLPVHTKRHVPEHWEIDEALTIAPPMIRAYVGLKRITGLRQTDMLALRRDQWKEDGLHVTPSKTRHSSRKAIVFERTPELEAAVDACLAVQRSGYRPRVAGQHLFCTLKGQPYTPGGFGSIWQQWMRRALVQTKLENRFSERSIRTYVGSWSESDQDAAERLGHSSTSTTRRHYRERPAVVRPLKVEE